MDNTAVKQSFLVLKLQCLECHHAVRFVEITSANGVYYCVSCKNLYLLQNNIIVCLPKKFEIKEPYVQFYKRHTQFFVRNHTLRSAIERIIKRLPHKRNLKWEDEDVEYWDKKYGAAIGALSSLRSYTRERYLFRSLRKSFKKGDYILEIGSGLAESVTKFFSPRSYAYTYIASDYSYKALLELQKYYKNQKNILYVQCLGNRVPFKAASIDHVICLGVLHHLPEKEKHLTDIIRVLKPGGLLLLNEVYARAYQLPGPMMRWVEHFIEPAHSAHEERVNWKRMEKILQSDGRMIVEHHEYSPTRTLLVRLFNDQIENSQFLTEFVLLLDEITMHTLGKIWKLFNSGACLIVYQKKGMHEG